MRGKGEGSYTKRSDGRWQGAIQIDKKRHTVYGKTRKEVADKIAELKKLHERGVDLGEKGQTVEEYLKRWLEDVVRVSNRPTTIRRYEGIVNKYLIPELGRYKLRELKPQQVQVLIKNVQHLAPRGVRNVRAVLRKALNDALRWRLIEYNPAAHVTVPKAEKYEARIFTKEEANRFREVIKGHRLEALYLLAMSLGMREGELLGLRKEDIDLDKRELRIRGQIQLVEGKTAWVPTKTEHSKRALPILELIVPALERILAEQPDSPWVFPSETGTAILPRNLVRQYKALLVKAKLPTEIRFHDLRHFAGATMITEGADVRTVMEVLGHTEVGTTLNVYAQSRPEKKRSAVESAVKAIFGEGNATE